MFAYRLDVVHFSKNIFSKKSKNSNQFFEKFRKISKKIRLHNLYFLIIVFGSKRLLLRYNMTIDYGSIKNGQIITDLAKNVHFGKYYFNKLQLNFKK
jgi:hypothetical protein